MVFALKSSTIPKPCRMSLPMIMTCLEMCLVTCIKYFIFAVGFSSGKVNSTPQSYLFMDELVIVLYLQLFPFTTLSLETNCDEIMEPLALLSINI